MVEVIKELPKEDTMAKTQDIWTSLSHNLPGFLLVVGIIVLAIIIYTMWKNNQERDKQRDHPVYEAYCSAQESCMMNKKYEWVDCKWSPVNLLWFGIPIIKREHSAKIRDRDNNVLGWYRGHCINQLGYYDILLYKTKRWLIFENLFVLRCPYYLNVKVKKTKNVDGKLCVIYDRDGKTPMYEQKKMDFRGNIQLMGMPSNDIRINAVSFESHSYFVFPVYCDTMEAPINLSAFLDENIIDVGHGAMLTHVFEDGAKSARKAMEHNPEATFRKSTHEQVKDPSSTGGN